MCAFVRECIGVSRLCLLFHASEFRTVVAIYQVNIYIYIYIWLNAASYAQSEGRPSRVMFLFAPSVFITNTPFSTNKTREKQQKQMGKE